MIVTQVTARCYAKINLGNFSNSEVGFEMTATLEAGETPEQAARQLFALCQDEARLQARELIRRRRLNAVETLNYMPEALQVKILAAIEKQAQADQETLESAV